MQHIAILSKRWHLLDKILSGEKTIESRWYKNKHPPWKKIKSGEEIYFKESGKPVTAKATAANVLFFDNLNKDKIKKILEEYGKQICMPPAFVPVVLQKRYCILIFLQDIQKIKPFRINKKGYGMMVPWICVDNIDELKEI